MIEAHITSPELKVGACIRFDSFVGTGMMVGQSLALLFSNGSKAEGTFRTIGYDLMTVQDAAGTLWDIVRAESQATASRRQDPFSGAWMVQAKRDI